MKRTSRKELVGLLLGTLVVVSGGGFTQAQASKPASSYTSPIEEDLTTLMPRMQAAKAGIMQRQSALLRERHDLDDRPAEGVNMARGKPVEGVRVKLRAGSSWDSLGEMSPAQIKSEDLFPAGFLPLPHPNHAEGGMLFPQFLIDDVKRQTHRDLTRFDLVAFMRQL